MDEWEAILTGLSTIFAWLLEALRAAAAHWRWWIPFAIAGVVWLVRTEERLFSQLGDIMDRLRDMERDLEELRSEVSSFSVGSPKERDEFDDTPGPFLRTPVAVDKLVGAEIVSSTGVRTWCEACDELRDQCLLCKDATHEGMYLCPSCRQLAAVVELSHA